ncbi:MAG: hypothetical protein NZ581_07025, partial [Candidatus Caldarchaeum sp.]|nr:hypothetical protein [Candidatus Caldarchaeum sp.]MDW8435930.1 hypothetical protein [Candidatus Caldarchaeum sp.]
IVVTDYNTYGVTRWLGEEGYLLGVALPNPNDPKHSVAAVAAGSYYLLFYEGMSATVAHEIGHALGLRHPHDDFDEQSQRNVGPYWIYTDSIETFMAYSTTWVEAVKRKVVGEGYYPVRTFWSIFDLDAIDRATITILLQGYEENYASIIKALSDAGLSLEEFPTLKNALGNAVNLARQSVAEFKRMNYFNRFEFKGLGAETTTSFEYAFMAWATTDLLKLYVEGVVRQNERLAPLLDKLEDEINALTDELKRLEEQRKGGEAELNRIEERIRQASATANELRNRLKQLENEAQQLPELEKRKSELETRVSEARRGLEQLTAEASQLRNINMTLMVVAIAVVAASISSLFLTRRRSV